MKKHLILVILDSCRYDAFVAASTPNMDRIGTAERRWSYASWTSPSHYVFLMGLLPHTSPAGVFASEVYKNEFTQWVDRLGVDELSFKDFLPQLSLPKVLSKLGYRTVGRVSMPVLNKFTLLSHHFDDYKLMDNHNDFAGMVREIELPEDEPHFYFLNLGETHYPYMLTGDDLPIISGVHGVFKALGEEQAGAAVMGQAGEFFDTEKMRYLQQQQVRTVEYVDGLVGELLSKCPQDTHLIVTADHGELFGEDGYFGHGPVMHPKVFEVPFLEGGKP
jgi:hypothetical protein